MKHYTRWYILILFSALGLLVACGGSSNTAVKVEPAKVEPIAGTDFNRVTLTERAFQRLAIETETITEETIDGETRMVIPYSAILYGLNGETWAYVNTAPLTYQRESITIDHIRDDTAVLTAGPPLGTQVVTVGVAELFGTDTGVGK